jgi:alpha-pyrone synthase
MPKAFINEISVATPPSDIHEIFISYANSSFPDAQTRQTFSKYVRRSHIDHRYSFLTAASFEAEGLYAPGQFADVGGRMRFFERNAIKLVNSALTQFDRERISKTVTHLVVASCTGFYAPGLDIDIVKNFNLDSAVERIQVGFMGCYAGITALRLARHIVRSTPEATVLVVNVELCTLHLPQEADLEQMLCYSLWGDGCSASLVSAEPHGIELVNFHSTSIEDSAEQMSWRIGATEFEMKLSGRVPKTLASALPAKIDGILGGHLKREIGLWAVHPGGRAILDAVAFALGLADHALADSRDVLRRFGNM